jgi:hypothetical protein
MRLSSRKSIIGRNARINRASLHLESLEDRCVPSNYSFGNGYCAQNGGAGGGLYFIQSGSPNNSLYWMNAAGTQTQITSLPGNPIAVSSGQPTSGHSPAGYVLFAADANGNQNVYEYYGTASQGQINASGTSVAGISGSQLQPDTVFVAYTNNSIDEYQGTSVIHSPGVATGESGHSILGMSAGQTGVSGPAIPSLFVLYDDHNLCYWTASGGWQSAVSNIIAVCANQDGQVENGEADSAYTISTANHLATVVVGPTGTSGGELKWSNNNSILATAVSAGSVWLGDGVGSSCYYVNGNDASNGRIVGAVYEAAGTARVLIDNNAGDQGHLSVEVSGCYNATPTRQYGFAYDFHVANPTSTTGEISPSNKAHPDQSFAIASNVVRANPEPAIGQSPILSDGGSTGGSTSHGKQGRNSPLATVLDLQTHKPSPERVIPLAATLHGQLDNFFVLGGSLTTDLLAS